MKSSENFELEEFTKSATAERRNISNVPGAEEIKNITNLVTRLLQPLRDIYKEPFTINSGFRSLALNKEIGGAPSSQHLKGEAADVKVKEPNKLLSTLIKSRLEFDQAILYPTFLHLSFKDGKNRNVILYAKG